MQETFIIIIDVENSFQKILTVTPVIFFISGLFDEWSAQNNSTYLK